MVKILHISQSHGGVKTYINSIVENNVDVNTYIHYLICSSDYGKSEIFEQQYMLESFIRTPNLYNDYKAFKKILSLVKTIKPDIIHCHSSKGGLHGRFVAWLTNTPVIFTPNGLSYLGFKGLKRRFFIWLERLTSFNSYALAVSNSEAERLINEVYYQKQKVIYVQNFVKVPSELNRNYDLRNRVGMIGRITYQKNPLLYLKIAKAITRDLPDVKFILLGAGIHDHLVKEVNSFLNENNLTNTVIIERWSTYSDIFEFYRSIDVFVLTSMFEGLSFSLLEAMSVGTPVVVTEVDGNKDVINNFNGTISNSIDVLIAAIKELLLKREQREKIGQIAYNHVQQFNNVYNVNNIYAYYLSVAESKNH